MTSSHWKKTFLFFLPLSLCTALVFFVVLKLEINSNIKEIEAVERHSLKTFQEIARLEFQFIVEDLHTIRAHHELKHYLQTGSRDAAENLHNDWGALMERRGIYDQIRFIDAAGQERIRLNYLEKTAKPVADDLLQDKSNRYYFRDTLALTGEQVFVSPLDLNVENGRIERPFKPMIRFGLPVIDADGRKQGIIVLNYLADHFLTSLSQDPHRYSLGELMLVNNEGFWLLHPDPSREWGFMLDHNARIQDQFPAAWTTCQKTTEGQFRSEKGLITFLTIKPFDDAWVASDGSSDPVGASTNAFSAEEYAWKLVAHIPSDRLATMADGLKTILFGLWLGLSILFWMTSRWLVRAIDDREKAYTQLQRREKDFRLLLNSTAEGIYGVDQKGRCTFFNRAAEHMLGYEETEVLGRSLHDLIWHTDRFGEPVKQDDCSVNSVIVNGRPREVADGTLWRKDDCSLNVEYRVHPIVSDGQASGAVVTFSDITEKKRQQELQLRLSQLSALGEVAAGVAHEINNPINGIINYAQLLLNKGPEDREQTKVLSRIVREGNRIAEIVRNLLYFSQKDRHEKATIPVRSIVKEPLNLLYQKLRKDGILLDIDVSEDLPAIYGNAMQLEQVLLNLISNASHALNRKFPQPDSNKILRILARVEKDLFRKYLQLEVWDQGCGIPEDHLKKIFNPFFTTKEAGVGTGLGLSVSQEILLQHDAEIFIESRMGEYTRVVINFPLADEAHGGC